VGGPIGLHYRLYDSKNPALRSNLVGLNLTLLASPALVKTGLELVVQPLSVLSFGLSYEVLGFFGNFDFLQSFPSATSESSDADIKALGAAKLNYPGYGGVLTFSALFQVKFGPIALRSDLHLIRYDMHLRAGDTVFYDPILDILSPKNGLTITDDTDLLYVSNVGLAGGVRYTVTQSFFTAQNYAPGEAQVNPNGIHRLGPFLAYTFFDRESSKRFNAPTLVLVAQWHIVHRYRAGEQVSAALPWLALAFTFKGVI
jgi:hypothetical protein